MKRIVAFVILYLGVLTVLNILLMNSIDNSYVVVIGFIAMLWVYFLMYLCTCRVLKMIQGHLKGNHVLPLKATSNVVVWTLLFYFVPVLSLVLSIVFAPRLTPFYALLIFASTYPVTTYLLSPMIDFKNMLYALQMYGINSFRTQAYTNTFVNRVERLYGKGILNKIIERKGMPKIR